MGDIELTDHDLPYAAELVELYGSVGWNMYTREPSRLHDALRRSLRVVCAREDGRLVGLARVVGDGLTVVFLQDILVAPTHRHAGLGRALFERVFEPYAGVRRKVLLTDERSRQSEFYQEMGFRDIGILEHPLRAFLKSS